jgi:CYTH domain-containing protein
MVQGFLTTDPGRTVRVRIAGDKGFLTVKGPSNESGTSRYEWEREIPLKEARELMALCPPPLMEKYRYRVPFGQHVYEVDEFLGVNQGLVVAEVELEQEDEAILKPDWLGKEVTGNPKYYNSQLSLNPFATWKKEEEH